jgi:hypothetical protein
MFEVSVVQMCRPCDMSRRICCVGQVYIRAPLRRATSTLLHVNLQTPWLSLHNTVPYICPQTTAVLYCTV